ncbi:tyrosine-type recombinase/integrase [Sphingobium sp. SCG-1]|uniref:tyrosine-type recombinase/integrase n=1 Tax=Sphingobium sp. SCG-1 TaxID=2072936 RepID=UPI0029500298|nr:tyrosine-type recombinase/integrase [Sphingobium sp. SCG-1]
MPYTKVPDFMTRLVQRKSFSRLALRFAILTAVRSGEVRGASWDEIDVDAKLWTIPKERMKASREHVIPLSKPALSIIMRCQELRIGSRSLIFPGAKGDAPMSDMTLTKLLREMNRDIDQVPNPSRTPPIRRRPDPGPDTTERCRQRPYKPATVSM